MPHNYPLIGLNKLDPETNFYKGYINLAIVLNNNFRPSNKSSYVTFFGLFSSTHERVASRSLTQNLGVKQLREHIL